MRRKLYMNCEKCVSESAESKRRFRKISTCSRAPIRIRHKKDHNFKSDFFCLFALNMPWMHWMSWMKQQIYFKSICIKIIRFSIINFFLMLMCSLWNLFGARNFRIFVIFIFLRYFFLSFWYENMFYVV